MSLSGSHIAKKRVIDHLRTNLPAFCAGVEASEGLAAGLVPAPLLYVQGPERNPDKIPGAGPGKFPAVFVGGGGIHEIELSHGGGTGPVFEVRYDIAVTFWCSTNKSRDYDGIELQRDRLDVAIRSCLMSRPTIVDGIMRVELESFDCEFLDAFESSPGHPQSAGRVQFIARQLEDLVPPALVEPEDMAVSTVISPL